MKSKWMLGSLFFLLSITAHAGQISYNCEDVADPTDSFKMDYFTNGTILASRSKGIENASFTAIAPGNCPFKSCTTKESTWLLASGWSDEDTYRSFVLVPDLSQGLSQVQVVLKEVDDTKKVQTYKFRCELVRP